MMANFFESFYWVYVLESLKDGKKYTGYTKDLPSRFEAHQNGEVTSTKHRRPFKLIYFEGCLNQQDATKREKYLPCGIKSGILMQSIIPQGKKHITARCIWEKDLQSGFQKIQLMNNPYCSNLTCRVKIKTFSLDFTG